MLNKKILEDMEQVDTEKHDVLIQQLTTEDFLNLTRKDFLEIVEKAAEKGCSGYYAIVAPRAVKHLKKICNNVKFPIPVYIGQSSAE